MEEPVVTQDGQTYERHAIEYWLRDHDTSPLTGQVGLGLGLGLGLGF